MDVSLLVTCLTDTFYPRVGEAVVRVLEHFGCRVDFPADQTCCGQPMYNTGCHTDAAALARRTVDVFEGAECVVTPSGSCCAMIRDYYPSLLEADPRYQPRCERFVDRTYEFTEFLLQRLGADLRSAGCRWPGDEQSARVTYHYSCHLRGLGMRDEAVRLLRQIEGIELVDLEKTEQCCGFGGTFAVKYPHISGAMVGDKVDCVERSGAEVLVCNDGGCTLNIEGALHRRARPVVTKHIAEIIAEGLGLMPVQRQPHGAATVG